MPCLPKLMAALALAAVAAWLVRNRPEQDPETYPVQPIDPRLWDMQARQSSIDLNRIVEDRIIRLSGAIRN